MFGKILTLIGCLLLVWAWISAGGIPKAAHQDFGRLVQSEGGLASHTPDFPSTYKQMSANRRLLQNLYIGAAGLICLSTGLINWKELPAQGNGKVTH